MTELIPFTTAHLGESNFYFLFYRKDGKVVSSGTLYEDRESGTDDVIGINLHKIITRVVERIEQR
jgi:hypothetical protein